MKKENINYAISILLLFSITITGMLGYVQSELELRKFVPHRYFAFITLSLAEVHFILNSKKLWLFIKRKYKKEERNAMQTILNRNAEKWKD